MTKMHSRDNFHSQTKIAVLDNSIVVKGLEGHLNFLNDNKMVIIVALFVLLPS